MMGRGSAAGVTPSLRRREKGWQTMARPKYDGGLTESQVEEFQQRLSRLEYETKNVRNDLHAAMREQVVDGVPRRFFNRGFWAMKRLDYVRFILGGVEVAVVQLERIPSLPSEGPECGKREVEPPQRHEEEEADD